MADTERRVYYSELTESRLASGRRYLRAHHNKSPHPIYQILPPILEGLMDDHWPLEGFVIGGSYANGRYQDGDDIDFDWLLAYHPDLDEVGEFDSVIGDTFRRLRQAGLTPNSRLPAIRTAIPETRRKTMFRDHPNTPFVVVDEETVKEWGLDLERGALAAWVNHTVRRITGKT